MGDFKKILNPRKYAKKKEEEALRQAEAEAETMAKNQAATADFSQSGEVATAQAATESTPSSEKKKLRGGRKSLTVARSSGAGINL